MSESDRYFRWICYTLTGLLITRALYVFAFPFDLSGDEAYYWDWGRQLDWGYFSKPPFIAWAMAFADWIGGGTDTGIRLMAALMGTLSQLFLVLLARKMFGNRTAFWALILAAAAPGSVALNLIFTIDAPLMLFWAASLWTFYKIVDTPRPRSIYFFLLALFMGLGLLSKQMMAVFLPLSVLYLLLEPSRRPLLKDWRLWATWLAAFAFLIPTLHWNTQNEWITASHTQHHFEGKTLSFLSILTRTAEYLGSQAGLLSPVTALICLLLMIASIRHFKSLDHRLRFLVLFSVPGLLVVFLMLIRQSINPNWPAVFYATLLILAGAAVSASPGLPTAWKQYWPRWKYPALGTGIGFALLVKLSPFIMDWTGQTGASWDPLVRLQGWRELAHEVQRHREFHRGQLNNPFVIATGHRYTTSHLAFYLVDQPRVYQWPNQHDSIESQYQLWGFPDELAGSDALIVVPGRYESPPLSLRSSFQSLEEVGLVVVTRSAKRTRYYTLYTGKGFEIPSFP